MPRASYNRRALRLRPLRVATSPTAGLARMAGVATLGYADLIRKICDHALARRGSNYTERFVKTLRLSGLG